MDIRPSVWGNWYPHDAESLSRLIERLLDAVPEHTAGEEVRGLVVPHAGYAYSGPIAAHAFARLEGRRPDLVAVLSPMHRPFGAELLTSGHDAYQTPLGSIPVAHSTIERLDDLLRERVRPGLAPVWNDDEHAIEVELPFLQFILPSFELLPVMIRTEDADVLSVLGHALAEVQPDLVIASSDLSHFFSMQKAQDLDERFLRRLTAFDPSALLLAEKEGDGYACGCAGIAATLWACRDMGARQVQVLAYGTSADASGRTDAVVGYAAAAIA